MKISHFSSSRRIQFLKLGKRNTHMSVERQAAFDSSQGSYFVRQLVRKFKSQWKQALGWQRSSSVQYSYDIRSYSLNFDDGGFFNDSLSRNEQYHEVFNLTLGRSQSLNSTEEIMNSKESGILEYLTGLLGGELHQLWKLSPALAAAAIPSWSPLFRLYLSEIETQFKEDSSIMRCCNCNQDMKGHKDCGKRATLTMKISHFSSSRRIQFLKLGKRNTHTSVERQAAFDSSRGSYFVMQLVRKFKSQWKQALGWQRSSSVQYSYDIRSYSLNFDDGGLFNDSLSRNGSR